MLARFTAMPVEYTWATATIVVLACSACCEGSMRVDGSCSVTPHTCLHVREVWVLAVGSYWAPCVAAGCRG